MGGAQHVAVNLTIRAQDNLMQPIQRTLNESIRGGSFLQTVNNSGMYIWLGPLLLQVWTAIGPQSGHMGSALLCCRQGFELLMHIPDHIQKILPHL